MPKRASPPGRARATLLRVSLQDFLRSLPAILLLVGIGRALLACLPVGRVGAHGPEDLLETLATSFALGLLFCGLATQAGELAGRRVGALALLLPVLALAALRWWSLPGRQAPGRPELQPRAPALARRALELATLAALAHAFERFQVGQHAADPRLTQVAPPLPPLLSFEHVLWLFGSGEHPGYALAPWCQVAIVALVLACLLRSRRLRLGRLLIGFALAFAPVAPHWAELAARPRSPILGALFLTAGVAAACAHLRSADRRARALALVFLAAPPLIDPSYCAFSLLALAAFALSVAPATRSRLIAYAGLAALPGAWILFAAQASSESDPLAGLRELFHLSGPSGLWLLLALATLVRLALGFLREAHPVRERTRQPLPLRELCYLALLLAFAPILAGSAAALDGPHALLAQEGPRSLIALLTPWMAMFCGLVLIPGELELAAR